MDIDDFKNWLNKNGIKYRRNFYSTDKFIKSFRPKRIAVDSDNMIHRSKSSEMGIFMLYNKNSMGQLAIFKHSGNDMKTLKVYFISVITATISFDYAYDTISTQNLGLRKGRLLWKEMIESNWAELEKIQIYNTTRSTIDIWEIDNEYD